MIEDQLEKLIKSSLFLDSRSQKMLLSNLENVSQEKKEELLKILQSQEAFLRAGFKLLIQKNGKDGLSQIDQLFIKAGGKLNKEKEVQDRSAEELAAEKLLSDIDNA